LVPRTHVNSVPAENAVQLVVNGVPADGDDSQRHRVGKGAAVLWLNWGHALLRLFWSAAVLWLNWSAALLWLSWSAALLRLNWSHADWIQRILMTS
jgi:hypothetical protein